MNAGARLRLPFTVLMMVHRRTSTGPQLERASERPGGWRRLLLHLLQQKLAKPEGADGMVLWPTGEPPRGVLAQGLSRPGLKAPTAGSRSAPATAWRGTCIMMVMPVPVLTGRW